MVAAKEYLSKAFYLNQMIESKLKQASRLREIAEKATAAIEHEKISQTRPKSRMEELLVKIIDLENEINDDIDKLIDIKREISEAIKTLATPTHRMILEMRYLECRSWDDIADILDFDIRWVYRLHKRALNEIEGKI